MAFTPFGSQDFNLMASVNHAPVPQLEQKINELRNELCNFPEYDLDFFRKRIVRRPTMRGSGGLVFGLPRWDDKHWYFYTVGGDQDQVQLNIAMWPTHIRVGMAFMIGRQENPKIPAFQVFQSFLGMRPPLPFRNAFFNCVAKNKFDIEEDGDPLNINNAAELVNKLETHVIPLSKHFILIGKIWDIDEASTKTAEDYRNVLLELMPFYEELLLAGGRYTFYV